MNLTENICKQYRENQLDALIENHIDMEIWSRILIMACWEVARSITTLKEITEEIILKDKLNE